MKSLSFLVIATFLVSGFFVFTWQAKADVTLSVNASSIPDGVTTFANIQTAINAAVAGDTINVAAGTYDLTSRIDVNKAVSIIGDVTTPANVIINAPTGGTLQGQNSVFVITSSDVTIRGFRIQGALHGAGKVQNAGIYVNDPNLLSNPGLSNITISNNEVTNNGYGIFAENIKNSTISNNKIYSNKKVVGKESESGVGIVAFGSAEDSNHTNTLTIGNNQVYSNETEGIRIDVESAVGATKFVNDLAIGITNNTVYNNGSTIVGVDKYVGIKSSGWSKGVTVSGNEIYGHTGATISATSSNAGIWVAASNGWVVNNNNVHDNLNGVFFAYSTVDSGSGSHIISNNNIHANVRGISIDDGSEAVANDKNSIYSNDSVAFSGVPYLPYGVFNRGTTNFDATNNYWGSADPDFTIRVDGNADVSTYYVNEAMTQTNVDVATTLDTAVNTANAKVEASYTTASWATFVGARTSAFALSSSTNALTITKTTAINDAMTGLVTVVVSNGGGSGYTPSACTSVAYGEWGASVNGMQYRDVISQNPNSCTLTTIQQSARSRAYTNVITEQVITEVTPVKDVTHQPVGQVLGSKVYAEGTLLKGAFGRIYVVVGDKLYHITSLKELTKFTGKKIFKVDESVISSYLKTTVLSSKKYGNGTLLRGINKKIFVVINDKLVYISNLKELAKYTGKKIVSVTEDELAQY